MSLSLLYPILFVAAGIFGVVGQAVIAWACILLAGVLALVT